MLNPYPNEAQQETEVKEVILGGDAIFVFSDSSRAFYGKLVHDVTAAAVQLTAVDGFTPQPQVKLLTELNKVFLLSQKVQYFCDSFCQKNTMFALLAFVVVLRSVSITE